MNARDELAAVVNGADWTSRSQTIADAILAAGYRKLEPVWAEGLENDGEYEYTTTWHCDGTFAAKWKRKPKLQAQEEYQPWQASL